MTQNFELNKIVQINDFVIAIMVGEIYLSSFMPYEAEIYEQTTHYYEKNAKKINFYRLGVISKFCHYHNVLETLHNNL